MSKKIVSLISLVLLLVSCASGTKTESDSTLNSVKSDYLFGRLAIIQGPTSDKETLINVLAPRLKDYKYEVIDQTGAPALVDKYETVTTPIVHYKIDKIIVKNLNPKSTYTLKVMSEFRGKTSVADQRTFKSLDISKSEVKFAALSCMADDWKFETIIDPMWARLKSENPDLVILNGDIVYVDSFDFVERKKATETDLWLRYIDALNRIPYYHWLELKPTLATWDDHDFGTNDGDRDFGAKKGALKLFRGFFGGKALTGVWEPDTTSVTSVYTGFGQRFYLMDDRSFRQPNKEQKKKEAYGHWGEKQHKWLIESLKKSATPAWIFNGNQVFNGKALDFKETFEGNHSDHFVKFINELKTVAAPVVFSSGDIHFSEVMRIPAERIGYETFEITSSSMHSYRGDGWANPMRIPGALSTEYNFLVMDSKASANTLDIHVKSMGVSDKSYFQIPLKVKK
ncbi:MAG: alkaline phosphatase D family protein [Bdellovibrionaceae bacterium]|nr:alkaline phosphatase D family protein [Pseudobdellovibrionaceae bacterium]